MRRTTLAALALVCLPIATLAALPEASPKPDWTALEQDEPTPLQAAMEDLKQGQRGVKKLMADPASNQRALMEQLESMERACMTALGAQPEFPAEIGKERLPVMKVGYKRSLAGLLGNVLAMQQATLEGDAAALKAAYDDLSAAKKQGHKEYRDF